MATQMQEPQSNKPQSRKLASWMLWTIISIGIIAGLAFILLALEIVVNQGITQGASTLTVISIIFGIVVTLIGWMIHLIKQHHALPSLTHQTSSTPSTQTTSSNSPFSPDTTISPVGERANKYSHMITDISSKVDWGEAPYIDNFYGREQDSTILAGWIL